MRYFSFRSKQRLRRLGIGVLVALLILIALAIGIVIYLQRYLVYTADGARLDFSRRPGAEEDLPGNPNFQVEDDRPMGTIQLEDPDEEETPTVTRVEGYYVTVEMLTQPDAVRQALTAVSGPVTVLMDVRSIYGNYYYPSAVAGAEFSSLVDTASVQRLIEDLAGRPNIRLAARFPALRDSSFAVQNQSCGLPVSGGALWVDEDNCYWLDPADAQTLAHLEQVILELKTLGFDEVVLDDFRFPESANIVYEGDRAAAIAEAAQRLAANLAGVEVELSVGVPDAALAGSFARVYLSGVDGSQVQSITQSLASDFLPLESRLVFLTGSRDTRFAQYGLLRPALES